MTRVQGPQSLEQPLGFWSVPSVRFSQQLTRVTGEVSHLGAHLGSLNSGLHRDMHHQMETKHHVGEFSRLSFYAPDQIESRLIGPIMSGRPA